MSTMAITLDVKQVRIVLQAVSNTFRKTTHREVAETCATIIQTIADTKYEHTGKRPHPGSVHGFTTLPPHDEGKVRRAERKDREESARVRDYLYLQPMRKRDAERLMRVAELFPEIFAPPWLPNLSNPQVQLTPKAEQPTPIQVACDTITARAFLASVLPFARSRAEDMHHDGGDDDPGWLYANSVITQAEAFLKRE